MTRTRWDAGEEWLRRRFAVSEEDRCPSCAYTSRRTERAACWRTARHIAAVYKLPEGLRGQSVRGAAFVIGKLGRDAVRPVEAEIERMLAVRQRLGTPKHRWSKYVSTTGAELLRIVKGLLNEHTANR